jgi:hypothetical protein
MAAFAPTFTSVQASDGSYITITDTSPWGVGNNDENYLAANFVRTFELYDAYDDLLDTITLSTSSNVATYDIDANTNPWIKIVFIITGVEDFEKIQKYPFQRYYELAYISIIKDGCGCTCEEKGIDICQVDAYYQGAQIAVPLGNGVQYQEFINSAFTLINP